MHKLLEYPFDSSVLLKKKRRIRRELKENGCSVVELADRLEQLLDQKGWSAFSSPWIPCGLARPRRQEIFAAFNRYRR